MRKVLMILGLVGTTAWAAPDVVPTQSNEQSESTFDRSFATTVGTDTAESGSTAQVINATAHAARVGDILRFTTVGANFLVESHVNATTTNTIQLTRAVPAAPSVGNGFTILRLLSPSVDTSGAIATTGGGGGSNASVGVNGAGIPASATLIGAEDIGGFLQPLQLDAVGALIVTAGAGDTNYGTPTAATSRTAAMLGLGSTAVSNANPVPVSDAGGSLTIDGTVAATQSTSPWVVNGSGFTQPISAATLPLPTGAATSALQTTANVSLAAIDLAGQPAFATGTAGALNADLIPSTDVSAYSSITIMVTGTLVGNIRAQFSNDNVNFTGSIVGDLGSTTGSPSTSVVTGGQFVVPVAGRYFRLRITAYTSGTATAFVTYTPRPIDYIGNRSVTVTNAFATSALQTTANTSLASIDTKATANNSSTASIDTKTPALGQATMAASSPIVIASNQSAIPVTGTLTPSALDYGVSSAAQRTAAQVGNATGQADFNAGTTGAQTLRVVLPTDQTAIPVTGTFFQATQPVSGTFFQATQPVSAASLPLPTGASTSALQTTGNASLSSIDTKLTSPITVTGTVTATNASVSTTGTAVPASATMVAGSDGTNLRAISVSATGVVAVDGSGVTQPISAASLPLPTGAATSANQTTANGSLASIDSKLTSPLAVTGTFFQATQPVSIAGTVTTTITGSALDHGASSAALRVVEANGAYADSVYRDYVTGAVTTGAWTELIASTAANIHHLLVSDTCGEVLELGTGAAAAETRILLIPRGGVPTLADITIPSGTRLSLRAVSATCPATAGTEITITGIN